MNERILVINPNSSQAVTDDIARALDGLRADGDRAIDCMTLAEGPPGIETQRHVDEVVAPLCRTIEIDLRQTLGEKELPQPLEPVDGVLM